ncbi:MAG TPA: ABC transporter transmembrane domain-containing protein [Acetobacteraceae bacterium]|nr:ABC transporter transmembrane domain-containing protein [Acetobacteraceae bacterium]
MRRREVAASVRPVLGEPGGWTGHDLSGQQAGGRRHGNPRGRREASSALFDLPWIPLYLGIVFAFHPLLGITAAVGGVLLFALAVLSEMLAQKPMKAALESWQKRQELAEAGRRNAEAVAAMGFGGRLAHRWQQINRDHVSDQQRASDVTGGFGTLSRMFRLILQSAVLGIGAYLVINQQLTAGVIIASSTLTARTLAPIDLTIAHWKGFIAACQGWQRLGRLLALVPAAAPRLELPAPKESVSVETLSLATPGDGRPIVQNVSFSLQAGQGLGIIGPSASGKSSLARALYGDPFFVVLDEPNSNLDAEGETSLTRAILSVRRRNGNVIVIAHRPSALVATDTILVMRQGRLERFGPKNEVLPSLVRPVDAGRQRLAPAVAAR